ncbi:MAG: hypothetical protein MR446_08315 [Bacteroidales bacterium]|nr:hypothetical protein [Bacteroidales bacterium]
MPASFTHYAPQAMQRPDEKAPCRFCKPLSHSSKAENYWCPVNLYERPYKRRVLVKRIEGVASDAVEEKSPAVEESSYGVEESSHGGLFLRRATPPQIDAT